LTLFHRAGERTNFFEVRHTAIERFDFAHLRQADWRLAGHRATPRAHRPRALAVSTGTDAAMDRSSRCRAQLRSAGRRSMAA
jgi:hypothetical protein